MSGWLPIEIVLDRYPAMVWPGVVPEASVRWMYFGSKRLSEPFFSQSVARLRDGDCPALEIETNIKSLTTEGRREPRIMPAGFIFHMSRCGSTLISNALKVFDGIQVAAEARPVTRLFMPCAPQDCAIIDTQRDEQQRNLAECLFNLFSCYRNGNPESIVFKFMSQNSLCLPTIRKFWPDVPCLFIIRDPVDVMVSNLKDGGLNRFTESPAVAYEICGADRSMPLTKISVEDFCARVLGRYLDAFIGEITPNVRVIDYDDINPASVPDIMKLFHLDVPSDLSSVDAVFRRYSKDPHENTPFYGDRDEKLECASRSVIDAANRWVIPQYTQLRSSSARGLLPLNPRKLCF
jgi:hypothetical protein